MPEKLTHDEKIILLALCKYIISSDGYVTDSELESLNKIAREKGFKDYQQIFNDVDEQIKSVDDLKKMIADARGSANMEKIISYAIQISRADGNIKDDEIEILTFIADSWGFDLKDLMK